MCAVTGMTRVQSLLDVVANQPTTNTNLRHTSGMVNNVQRRTTNSYVPENRVRESQMPQRMESKTRPFKQRQTCLQQTRGFQPWRTLKLSLRFVAARHWPRPRPTVVRRPTTHASTGTEKTMAGIIHCSTSRTKLPQQKRTDCQCSPRTNISHPSLRALVLTSSRKSCCACAQLAKHAI